MQSYMVAEHGPTEEEDEVEIIEEFLRGRQKEAAEAEVSREQPAVVSVDCDLAAKMRHHLEDEGLEGAVVEMTAKRWIPGKSFGFAMVGDCEVLVRRTELRGIEDLVVGEKYYGNVIKKGDRHKAISVQGIG